MALEQFENDFFKDEKPVHLDFELFQDQYALLQSEIIENGWSTDEGIRFFIMAGLRSVQDSEVNKQILGGKISEKSALLTAQNERMLLESKYAVMRYRAFQFMQAVKTLELKYNSALTQIRNLGILVNTLRDETGNTK